VGNERGAGLGSKRERGGVEGSLFLTFSNFKHFKFFSKFSKRV
jgi:hypothetical protein